MKIEIMSRQHLELIGVWPEVNANQMSVAVEILQCYNCRAAEVLSAEWKDFYPGKMLILHGRKGSANIIVRDRYILKLLTKIPKTHQTKIFGSISYYQLYRYVKKNYSHLFEKFKTRKNQKITHGWRYKAVEIVDNDKEIRDILHHRSTKSGKYYKKSKRR